MLPQKILVCLRLIIVCVKVYPHPFVDEVVASYLYRKYYHYPLLSMHFIHFFLLLKLAAIIRGRQLLEGGDKNYYCIIII